MIYLDNASTTKIDPKVFEAMVPYLTTFYGNPGSLCSLGRKSKKAVDRAREQVAEFVGANPENIVFTSGSTEANNSVIYHSSFHNKGKMIVTSSIEHESVLDAVSGWGKYLNVFRVSPNKHGIITAKSVQYILSRHGNDVALVSIMHTNNETGVKNEIEEIGKICNEYGVPFHTDCTQAAGGERLDVNKLHCDFLSISAHKIHGPKGVGALYVRDPHGFSPMIHGGHFQEFGLRSGTENVAGIVGLGCACQLINSNLDTYVDKINSLREKFVETLRRELVEESDFHINSSAGKVANIMFHDVDGETLRIMLDKEGVCVSAGSACRSHEQEPSYVLTSMGLTPDQARNSLRFSFSRLNNENEVVEAADIVAKKSVFLRYLAAQSKRNQ